MADRYAREAERLQAEQQAYLAKVRRGRAVRAVDPLAPQYSQAMEDQRQARALGIDPSVIRQQMAAAMTPGWSSPFTGGVQSPMGQLMGQGLYGVGQGLSALGTGVQAVRQALPSWPTWGSPPASPSRNRSETQQLEQWQRESGP